MGQEYYIGPLLAGLTAYCLLFAYAAFELSEGAAMEIPLPSYEEALKKIFWFGGSANQQLNDPSWNQAYDAPIMNFNDMWGQKETVRSNVEMVHTKAGRKPTQSQVGRYMKDIDNFIKFRKEFEDATMDNKLDEPAVANKMFENMEKLWNKAKIAYWGTDGIINFPNPALVKWTEDKEKAEAQNTGFSQSQPAAVLSINVKAGPWLFYGKSRWERTARQEAKRLAELQRNVSFDTNTAIINNDQTTNNNLHQQQQNTNNNDLAPAQMNELIQLRKDYQIAQQQLQQHQQANTSNPHQQQHINPNQFPSQPRIQTNDGKRLRLDHPYQQAQQHYPPQTFHQHQPQQAVYYDHYHGKYIPLPGQAPIQQTAPPPYNPHHHPINTHYSTYNNLPNYPTTHNPYYQPNTTTNPTHHHLPPQTTTTTHHNLPNTTTNTTSYNPPNTTTNTTPYNPPITNPIQNMNNNTTNTTPTQTRNNPPNTDSTTNSANRPSLSGNQLEAAIAASSRSLSTSSAQQQQVWSPVASPFKSIP